MLSRNVSLAVCLSVFAGAASAQSNQGTGYVFQFATATASSGQLQAFVYNTQSLGTPVFNTAGPTSANQVIAKPDGSKFYVIGSGGIDDFDPGFTTPKSLNGISGTINSSQTIISPDGRYLIIPSVLSNNASSVYLLNTSTDTIVLTQPISGTVAGVVVSRDSSTAWILVYEGGQAVIVVVNLNTLLQVGSPVFMRDPVTLQTLVGDPQALTLSPLGLLYISGGNAVLEITPSTLTAAALNSGTFAFGSTPVQIPVNATAGPLQFSTDGTIAYFINSTPSIGGRSLLSISIPGHTVNTWPSTFISGQAVEQFDSLVIAGPSRLFAHSANDTTLWDVSPDLSTVGVSALNSVLPATTVLSMALSDEIPSARYLFALVGTGGQQAILDRIDLTTNTITSTASAALGYGTLQFSIVPPETNPTSFITYNAAQNNLAAGTTALPLIARVLDPSGRPMFAVPVTFSGDPSLTFTGVSTATNADGYAFATVTLGKTAGNFPVTLTASSGSTPATTTFSLTIPGGVTGPTGGPSQMSIISGNGQLFQAFQSRTFNPNTLLTVKVVDTSGKPLVNQDVTFTVNVGTTCALLAGEVDNPNAITDVNGLASTNFLPLTPPQNTPFCGGTVTAVSALGGVTFFETVFQPNPDGTGGPSALVTFPVGTQVITAGEGDVVPGAIQGVVFSHSYGPSLPIPNIAMNIVTPDGTDNPGPGTCQGGSLTDNTGASTCNFIAACGTLNVAQPAGSQGFWVDFGMLGDKTGFILNVTPGSSQTLVIQSGNNQSGRAGSPLTLPLTATVTDQCGTPASGITVTWKVTQGSATLAQTTTVSNQGGTVATHATLGQAPGTVTIVASINSTTIATFTETIQAVVGSLKLYSGSPQSALQGTAFANPVIFQVTDSNNSPVPGLVINFGLAGGSASLSASSGTTNAQGQASVNVTAGNSPGTVTLTATYSTFSATATLTVIGQGPLVNVTSFVNAASGQIGLTPCGLALVTGSGLDTTPSSLFLGNPIGIGPLPYTLNGVTITVDGIPAPLQAVSNQNGVQQVNFQTPCEIPTGSPATVVVQVGNVSTQVPGVTVYPAQPGIFTFAGPSSIAYGWVVSLANGGTLTPSNLAQAGQSYYLVATGLGETNPAAITNSPGTGQTISPSSIILAINNVGVQVNSVEYVQGAIGEYIVTFTIPVPFATGNNLPLSLGVIANNQQFFDNSPVALPGIH